jgi:hypothetical protein
MDERPTRITCDIDFQKPGKQLSYLRLVHSDNRHAFGVVPVPIAVIANGEGPTVFLAAGNHGDEYEGQVLLQGLVRSLQPAQLRGCLIIMPALNYPAVLAGSRVSPLDHENFNRAFPGDPDGSPTFALSHFVETVILAKCSAAIDLHSGGRSAVYLPCVYLHGGGGKALLQRKIAAARAFGAPYTVVARATSDNRSMSAACDRRGVLMVATELAGGGTVTPSALQIGRTGLRRLLHHFGIFAGEGPRDGFAATRLIAPLGAKSSVMAPTEGLFEPFHDVGETVKEGDMAGVVHPVAELDRPSLELRFAHGGIVTVRRTPTLVARGDYLMQVAVEIDEATLYA